MTALALGVVVLAGLYLVALGLAALIAPARARRFLLGFASTLRLHLVEMGLRMLVGAALVVAAPRMLFPGAFELVGWVLLVSSACLLLVPWRWHRYFAERTVPGAVRYVGLIGLASLAMGGGVLAAVFL